MADVTEVKLQIGNPKNFPKSTGEVESKDSVRKEKQLKKACADFESVLYYYMLKGMRQTIPQSGFLKKSPGKDTYDIFFDQKIAEDLANNRRESGLQQTLFEQMNKHR